MCGAKATFLEQYIILYVAKATKLQIILQSAKADCNTIPPCGIAVHFSELITEGIWR